MELKICEMLGGIGEKIYLCIRLAAARHNIQASLMILLSTCTIFAMYIHFLAFKRRRLKIMEQTTIFNPVQQHLLKMFAFDGSEARLLEVQTVLANYFRKKADECLDSLWDSGQLNQAKLDELRHQDLHAMLKK